MALPQPPSNQGAQLCGDLGIAVEHPFEQVRLLTIGHGRNDVSSGVGR
jgi:hypothetical protein